MARVEAILISCPLIDLDSFINKTIAYTGHIITTGLDSSKLTLKHHPKFLALLGQLKEGKTTHPKKIADLSNHFSFSFLIQSEKELLFNLSGFGIFLLIVKSKTDYLAVATGTLKQWKDVMAVEEMESLSSLIRPQLTHLGLLT